ncbi:MAG: carboxypeptidase regulatory-like domain-containing protein [Planctomycetota bacterium]
MKKPLVLVALLVALGLGTGLVTWFGRDDSAHSSPGDRPFASPGASSDTDSVAQQSDDDSAPIVAVPDSLPATAATPLLPGAAPAGADAVALAEPTFVIEGVVLGANHEPVRSAVVEVFAATESQTARDAAAMLGQLASPPQAIAMARTDRRGAFRAVLAEPGEYLVRAGAAGYATQLEGPVRLRERQRRISLSFVLADGLGVAGRVVDSNGRPAAGVALHLLEKSPGAGFGYQQLDATSATDGTFRFDGVSSGRYILVVAEGTHGPGNVVPVVVAPVEDLEVRLASGVVVKGRIVDTVTRAPLAGVDVTALNPLCYAQATSDGAGRFELQLAGADADVLLVHDGYVPHTQRVSIGAAGPGAEVTFELRPGVTLDGRLQFPDGKPAAGATVGLFQGRAARGQILTSVTAGDGRFSFAGAADDAAVRLLAKLPGWWLPFENGSWSAPADGQLVEQVENVWTLAPTISITGRVMDAGGRPLANAWVGHAQSARGDDARAARWLRATQETWTDADGKFELSDVLPIAPLELTVEHADCATQSFPCDPNATQALELRVTSGGSLVIELEWPSGVEPGPASLIARLPGGEEVTRRVDGHLDGGVRYFFDSQGRLEIEHLPIGAFEVYVVAPYCVEETLAVALTDGERSTQRVSLRAASLLRVRVRGADGATIPMAEVRVSEPPGESAPPRSRRLTTDAKGEAVFGGLPPGAMRVHAQRGARATSKEYTLGAGDQTLELTLPAE